MHQIGISRDPSGPNSMPVLNVQGLEVRTPSPKRHRDHRGGGGLPGLVLGGQLAKEQGRGEAEPWEEREGLESFGDSV